VEPDGEEGVRRGFTDQRRSKVFAMIFILTTHEISNFQATRSPTVLGFFLKQLLCHSTTFHIKQVKRHINGSRPMIAPSWPSGINVNGGPDYRMVRSFNKLTT
jgi:hypothetical protein